MKLIWENIVGGERECQSYKLEALGLVYYLEFDAGRKMWCLTQVIPGSATLDRPVSSIEEAEDEVLKQLKIRASIVLKELELVKEWLGIEPSVHIVSRTVDYEFTEVICVSSTKEKAKSFVDKEIENGDRYADRWSVDEWKVDGDGSFLGGEHRNGENRNKFSDWQIEE